MKKRETDFDRFVRKNWRRLIDGTTVESAQLSFNAGRRAERRETCYWSLHNDDQNDFWNTECGKAQTFLIDGVKENKYRFCPYCGGKIVERKKIKANTDQPTIIHKSDCSLHNEPAFPNGPCDCQPEVQQTGQPGQPGETFDEMSIRLFQERSRAKSTTQPEPAKDEWRVTYTWQSGDIWGVDIAGDGKKHLCTVYGKSQQEAEAIAKQIVEAVNRKPKGIRKSNRTT